MSSELERDAGSDERKIREARLMQLLNSSSPEKMEHDLRNVLNELSLLRVLFEKLEQSEATKS